MKNHFWFLIRELFKTIKVGQIKSISISKLKALKIKGKVKQYYPFFVY